MSIPAEMADMTPCVNFIEAVSSDREGVSQSIAIDIHGRQEEEKDIKRTLL
jgi:hypothetical protein